MCLLQGVEAESCARLGEPEAWSKGTWGGDTSAAHPTAGAWKTNDVGSHESTQIHQSGVNANKIEPPLMVKLVSWNGTTDLRFCEVCSLNPSCLALQ